MTFIVAFTYLFSIFPTWIQAVFIFGLWLSFFFIILKLVKLVLDCIPFL